MNIVAEEKEYCKLEVACEIDAIQVREKRAEVAALFKDAPVPGFRPGAATMEAVRMHYRKAIDKHLQAELEKFACDSAVAEKNFKPFGTPKFSSSDFDGSSFKCKFTINKLPEFELKDYKGFDLPKPPIPTDAELSEKIIQEIRVKEGEITPFEDNDFVQDGDGAIINYSGFVKSNNEEVLKYKVDGEMFVVGRSPLEAFNENLLGMKVGETREFGAHVPIQGAEQPEETRFVVELSMGSKYHPAALDDALATKIGFKDIADLMGRVQATASVKRAELEKTSLSQQIALRLIDSHKLELPDWMVTFEAKLLARQNGITDWDSLSDNDKEKLSQAAKKNVELSLILDKVRDEEPEAQLSEEETFALLKNNIAQYKANMQGMQDKSDEEVFGTIQQTGFLPVMIAHIKDDFVMDFIIKNSKIVE